MPHGSSRVKTAYPTAQSFVHETCRRTSHGSLWSTPWGPHGILYAPRGNCCEVHHGIMSLVESYVGYAIEIARVIRYSWRAPWCALRGILWGTTMESPVIHHTSRGNFPVGRVCATRNRIPISLYEIHHEVDYGVCPGVQPWDYLSCGTCHGVRHRIHHDVPWDPRWGHFAGGSTHGVHP